MTLVVGVDSSTQSCKVIVCDADTGRVVREGRSPHPDGTEVSPAGWWSALKEALTEAGGTPRIRERYTELRDRTEGWSRPVEA